MYKSLLVTSSLPKFCSGGASIRRARTLCLRCRCRLCSRLCSGVLPPCNLQLQLPVGQAPLLQRATQPRILVRLLRLAFLHRADAMQSLLGPSMMLLLNPIFRLGVTVSLSTLSSIRPTLHGI